MTDDAEHDIEIYNLIVRVPHADALIFQLGTTEFQVHSESAGWRHNLIGCQPPFLVHVELLQK